MITKKEFEHFKEEMDQWMRYITEKVKSYPEVEEITHANNRDCDENWEEMMYIKQQIKMLQQELVHLKTAQLLQIQIQNASNNRQKRRI